MIGLATIGLKLLGVGKALVSGAVSIATKYPLQVALVASLLVTAWALHSRANMRVERDGTFKALVERIKAEKRAAADQVAVNKAHTTLSGVKAGEVQHDYVERAPRAERAADSFIRANRVRACPSAPGSRDPAAEDHSPAVPAGAPTDPVMVAVPSGDVTSCTALWNYATSAHELAKKQVAGGFAEWGN